MTINDQIIDDQLRYAINREVTKISALSSGKIHKFEYLTGEDILPSNQHEIIPANIRLEDVLKTYFVFVFRRSLQDVFKTS